MTARIRSLVALVAIIMLLAGLLPHVALAQTGDETINYNDPVIVTLTAGQSMNRYFAVLAGDNFELKLSRLAEFEYTAVLVDPAQNPLPLTPDATGNVTHVVDSAPQSGDYTIVLQATSGAGEMLIQINSDVVEPTPLPLGASEIALLDIGLRYSLTLPAGSGPMTLALSADAGLPGVSLIDTANGQTALVLTPGLLQGVTVELPMGSAYVLALEPGDAPQQVAINWGEDATTASAPPPAADDSSSSSSSGSSDSAGPGSSSSSGSSGSTTGPCQVYFAGGVNVRSGPGTDYEPPLGQVPAGTTLNVTGRSADYGWWQIDYYGQAGWVADYIGATEATGNCAPVGVVSAPPLNNAGSGSGGSGGPAYTPTATYTPAPTYTPGGPVYTPTPTYTPTDAAPVAPPDTNYSMPIPLDETLTLSDAVSYPNGDVEDYIGYRVTGLNNSVAMPGGQADLSIILQCSGTGSEYIVFRIDGQDYACGDTFTRRVNADSNVGGIRITATGGSATYAQWTVIGSAPRVN
jgi:hypothetical protein